MLEIVLYLYKQKENTMKTKEQDQEEVLSYIEGMKRSFVDAINETPSTQIPKRTITFLLEDDEGDYVVGGCPLSGTKTDKIVIPIVLSKVQEDKNRIVCIMEMVMKEDNSGCMFYFRGELGEEEENYEDCFEYEIKECYSVGDNGDLIREVEMKEID